MANDLAVIEANFRPLLPYMERALPPAAGIGADRIMQSIMIACEKTPKLMQCRLPTLQQAAFSACALGLLVDGTSGQGYLIPYGDTAQFVTGWKGYSTIAARSRYVLGGDLIYEGEQNDVRLGSAGHAWVKPDWTIRGQKNAKIIAAFSTLESNYAPSLVAAMSLDEIMAIRARSKGAAKAGGPWDTDFGQMAIKTAKRRNAKSCPLDVLQLAAALDDAVDMGQSAHIRPEDRALIVDQEAQPLSVMQPQPSEPLTLDDTKFGLIDAANNYHDLGSLANWQHQLTKRVLTLQSEQQINEFLDRNKGIFTGIAQRHGAAVDDMRLRMAERIDELQKRSGP